MKAFENNFFVLQCIGFWRPLHWSLGWKSKFYDCYTFFIFFLLVTLCLSQSTQLFFSITDVEAITNTSFMLLSIIGVCGKGVNLLIKRNEIIKLITILPDNPYRPITEQELAIQHKFDLLARFNLSWFGTIGMSTVVAMILQSLANDVLQRVLPFESWLPFDYHESLLGYSVAYFHQTFTLAVAASLNIAYDTFLPGLMLESCAQLNILKNRFHDMPSIVNKALMVNNNDVRLIISRTEHKLLSQCVEHHLEIIKFSKTANGLFGFIIFCQYTISTLALCVNVFELSKIRVINLDCISRILYIMTLLTQIYMYCYYGGLVSHESLSLGDAIHEMDWNSLSICARKSLLTILARTLRPIKYTSFYIITLDLESFKSLLKVSYSAFNLLQQT